MAFPWSVAITGGSTLAAGVGAALLTNRNAQRQERVRWRLDRQTEASSALLAAGVGVYTSLRSVLRDGEPYETIDWNPWNSALEQLSIVAVPDVAAAAWAWDTESWGLSMAARRLTLMPDASFQAMSEGFKTARLAFVNASRKALESKSKVPDTIARPPLTDELRSYDYWREIADRTGAKLNEQWLAKQGVVPRPSP